MGSVLSKTSSLAPSAARLCEVVAWLGIPYLALCLAVGLCPSLQRLLLYGHHLRLPISTYWLPLPEVRWTDLQNLWAFRIGHCARNVTIETRDGETLKAWHLVPPAASSKLCGAALKGGDGIWEELLEATLADPASPVVLYLHGQGGTRGMLNRLDLCKTLSAAFHAHVVMLDYRGFGDSTGSPSQDGLIEDALAAWEWVGSRSRAEVFVYGHSLGAAVAVQLAKLVMQHKDSSQLKGLILDAPFTSAAAAALKHPLGICFRWLPIVRRLLLASLVDRWESEVTLPDVHCPLLIFGAGHDRMVDQNAAQSLCRAAEVSRQAGKSREEARLVVLERASHSNIYASHEWMTAMADFMR
eukprot:TRINITY_DN92231_c0_g1_i1.p1 TRINITY_DN92231_c0_g1~~TRINITY_DN92231_c0_g1_i1.p1  ORF type:complete len:356 (-),score=56.21 TRINITY_DN92231_c0_g1_i1:16-1083(-)